MKKILFLFLFIFIILAPPSFAGISVVGGLSRERIAEPGEKYEGVISVKNRGDSLCQVKISQTDYLFFADGKNIYGEPGSAPRSNASWISLSPPRLTIPPKDIASAYYTVYVPENVDLQGTYWSMVMVEMISETSPESPEEEKGKVKLGLKTVLRYGVQILTHIGDTGIRKIKFLDKKLLTQNGKKILQLDIENIGERWLRPLVWVELYDKDGAFIGRFESEQKRIYSGCSVRHKIDLADISKGKYKAVVIVDNKDEHVFGAQYDLQIE